VQHLHAERVLALQTGIHCTCCGATCS
jgi:hypothetical protein